MAYFLLPVLRPETVLMQMSVYICTYLISTSSYTEVETKKNTPHPLGFNKSCVSGLPGNSGKRNAREGEKGKDI